MKTILYFFIVCTSDGSPIVSKHGPMPLSDCIARWTECGLQIGKLTTACVCDPERKVRHG